MSYFRYEDKQVYYEESGEGSPLILLHGNTSCGKMFDSIVPVFAAKYRVIVPDFLGNGQSERVEKWPSDLWFDWAKQVKALCNHLGLKKVKLIGSSGGALAAINVALEYPELVEYIVADSFEGLKADPGITEQIRNGRTHAKTFDGFTEYLKTLHGDDWEQVFDADTDAVLRHAEQIGDFFHKPIDELKVPMLLTGSLEDDMFPKGHCKVLFNEIYTKTSYATAHIFEHGGHPAMLSNMDEFVDLISSFIDNSGFEGMSTLKISQIMEKMIAFSEGNIHDIDHFVRVWNYAKTISELEEIDSETQYILEVAAITHDIACPLCREKYGNTNGKLQEEEGVPLIKEFLSDSGMTKAQIERVAFLVGHHHTFKEIDGLDWQILIEADYIANASENGYSKENINNFIQRIMKTESGIRLAHAVFCL